MTAGILRPIVVRALSDLLNIHNFETMSFAELVEQLRKEEETVLLELLEINSEMLVDAFLDKIKESVDKVYRYYG